MAKIAIFGIGVSGMAAAWSALNAGYDVTFYANTIEQSQIHGCQYLQAPILPASHNIRHTVVTNSTNGSVLEYRHKVYGNKWADPSTEGEDDVWNVVAEHDAWDLRETYDVLWANITRRSKVTIVAPVEINHVWIQSRAQELSSYAHVISTIPAPAICANPRFLPSQEGHMFVSQVIKATGHPDPNGHNSDYVLYDGTDQNAWYRYASVFGHNTIEFPRTYHLKPGERLVQVRKPLANECDCHPEIIRLGRFGAWEKGILAHHVYEQAEKLMRGEWV